MAAPQFVPRDYSGGVVQGVQLTGEMGSTDTQFTIASTVGWTNAAGNPLGTVGPFTVVIDLGTPSVEKILCSAINLSSGLVTVYTSTGYTGRGYDQTTPQAHVPGSSPAGVQPCWSAVEAAEANTLVSDVLDGGASNAQVLTWSSGKPIWAAAGAISPQGTLGYAQITTGQTGITSLVSITGLSVTVTVGTGRRLKISAYTPDFAGGSAASDLYAIYIVEGSTNLSGAGVIGNSAGLCQAIVVHPTAGSHTYFVQATHISGSTAGNFSASTTQPAYILVEDIGT